MENLNNFAINLTQKMKQNTSDPIIGRDKEISSTIRILSRKNKNNPILVGKPGVGKTAIIEGLALRIINNDVPDNLKNKEIYSLDLGSLIAGASFQGEFEKRLKSIINEVTANQDKVLLFIDEIHMLIGAGKTSSSMDAANLLKPALSRGELNCIGATTFTEYKENFEKDQAFARRFQKVTVTEPTKQDALNIMRGLKNSFETFHGVKITDRAIESSVELSSRYITDRYLPDKAIDLIDEACALINVQLNSWPESIDNLKRKITYLEIDKKSLSKKENKLKIDSLTKEINALKNELKLLDEKWKKEKDNLNLLKSLKADKLKLNFELEHAQNNYDYETAAKIQYDKLPSIQKEISLLEEKVKNNEFLKGIVDEEIIFEIISRISSIDISKLKEKDKDKILNIKNELEKNIKGQDEAIDLIYKTILRSKSNLNNPNKPLSSFLFFGPTGVGKTEVAKTIANVLFDNKDKIKRFDMGEFTQPHSVARLIGAPPGYIGFENGGELTEYVKQNPYSIILFDELEKAHSEVLNILLQILEEGELTDNQGNLINLKNTIIIMTSNIGSQMILDNQTIDNSILEKEILKYIKPEILNRIDNVIKFNFLDTCVYSDIVRKFMNILKGKLNNQKISLTWSDDVINFITEKSYQIEFGARVANRFIQDYIENEIAYKIISENPSEIHLSIQDDAISIETR